MATKIHPILAYCLPRLRDILFAGVLYIIVVIGGPRIINADGDLGRHITVGNYILETGTVPVRDIFSNTMYGERLVPHEWLAEVVFALAHRLMGLSGDLLLTALLISLTIMLIYEELLRRGVMRLAAVVTAFWLILISTVHWLARPHIFTFLFIALWAYWLEAVHQGRFKSIVWFPMLMFIWVNTHGAFIAGFVVWGTYFVDWLWAFWQGKGSMEMGRRLALIGILSVMVTFINPAGWHVWETSVGYVGNDFLTRNTLEYMSPNFHDRDMWPFMFMIAFGLFSLVQDRKLQVREGLLFAGWTILSLYSTRNFPLFAVVNAPVIGGLVQSWAEKIPRLVRRNAGVDAAESMMRGYAWPVVMFLSVSTLLWYQIPLDVNGQGNVYLQSKMPVKAVNWLIEHPQKGNMFNNFVWGGYILYRMWPNELVFIDGQTDFYGETLTREYQETMYVGEGWQSVLDKYKVEWIIAQVNDPLVVKLKSADDHSWKLLYEDEQAVILRRELTQPE